MESQAAQQIAQVAAPVAAPVARKAFNIDEWMSNLFDSSSKTVQALMFFTAFYFLGLLCRRYLRFVLWSVIFSFIVIKFLEFNHVITVDWRSFLSMFGLQDGFEIEINVLFGQIFSWIQNNIIKFAAGIFGFLFGYKPAGHHKGVAIKIAK